MIKKTANYKFVLTGNGPVTNLGCQAILKGTCRLLEKEFQHCFFHAASFAKDPVEQLPPNVEPFELPFGRPRWSRLWWKYRIRKAIGLPDLRDEIIKPIRQTLTGCDVMFSIGGDNYSIDYGYEIVERLILMNQCSKSMGIPVVLWGASIGPFDRDKAFEERIARHLSQLDLIVAREPVTKEYLARLGIHGNVVIAPDPAFAVDHVKPSLSQEFERFLETPFIGLNLSPILAKYITDGDLNVWREKCSKIIGDLLKVFDYPVLLIPHVTSPKGNDPRMDDALFLRSVRDLMDSKHKERVYICPGGLDCEETKWLISRADMFIGSRMHATIAAFSTGVPCISVAYSQKAWGMNEWLFGDTRWVVPAEEIDGIKLTEIVGRLQNEKVHVRSHLEEKVNEIKHDVYQSASHIKKILHT
jgi:polysaccharide pyruvyl transferase WcaK-like protein